jgi:glutaminase
MTQGLFFLKRVLEWELTIPHFEIFRNTLEKGYNFIKEDVNNEFQGGEVATYIPPLARADPKNFSTSFCSTDGQFTQFGDVHISFSIQSISKVVAYAYIHNILGEKVHDFVGEEPSGVAFNAPVFDSQNKPHNPMVNAGAIMVCSLIVNEGKNIDDLCEFYRRASDQ